MEKQKNNLLLKTIESAVLFSLAFLFIDKVAFFIIPSIFILFFILNNSYNMLYKNSNLIFYYGIVWGSIVFLLHTIWLYELLTNRSGAGFFLSISLYLFVIIYGSIITGLFFFIANKAISYFNSFTFKIVSFFIIFYFYINFISKYFLFFVSKNWGYPFMNPLIPLTKYKFFLFLINALNFNFNVNSNNFFFHKTKISYLKPVEIVSKQKVNAQTAALLIYNQISNLNLFEMKKKFGNLLIVSPETFYPYPLNENKYALELWDKLIPKETVFLLGSQRSERGKNYQTIYQIESGRIMNFYDKKHRVPFVEKIPTKFKRKEWSKTIFLNGKEKFSKGKSNSVFLFMNKLSFHPYICSDFFCKMIKKKSMENISLLIVNDSWFSEYFKKIMKYFVVLRSNQFGIIILYVNHDNYELIKPYNKKSLFGYY